MKLFYNDDQTTHHLSLSGKMRDAVDSLKHIQSEPSQIRNATDIFGKPVDTELWEKLTSGEISDKLISDLATGFVEVLKRQLAQYLTGNLSKPNEDMLQANGICANSQYACRKVMNNYCLCTSTY